jgi:hypothetical protein
MTPKPISTAYFINSPISLCVCMCIPHVVATQRPGKDVPAAKNTRNNTRRKIVRSVFLDLCIPLPLLGKNSAKTFPLQRRIVGDVFYAVRIAPKESRRLVLPRTSCLISNNNKTISMYISLWNEIVMMLSEIKATHGDEALHLVVAISTNSPGSSICQE